MWNPVRALSAPMIAAAWAILFTTGAGADASADRDLDNACRVIERDMHNCACVVSFLRERLGAEQGLLLLQSWGAYSGRLGDQSRAFATLYREHGADSLLETSINFLKLRTEFLTRCQPSAEFFEEREVIGVRAEPDF